MFPGRKVTAIFQPHLYTRTRDFAAEFAQSLSAVDSLVLLDIYPAREEPIPGVTSEIIFDNVTAPEKVLLRKEELMSYDYKDARGYVLEAGDYIISINSDPDAPINKIADYVINGTVEEVVPKLIKYYKQNSK